MPRHGDDTLALGGVRCPVVTRPTDVDKEYGTDKDGIDWILKMTELDKTASFAGW